MHRRKFIQGLLSLPFVGYVASKARDGVALFSRPHPIPHDAYLTDSEAWFLSPTPLSEDAIQHQWIEISGTDANGDKVSEVLRLNGTHSVTSVNKYRGMPNRSKIV